jgi:hypothetical protein
MLAMGASVSTRLRFNTAQQVFDAFPKVTAEIDLRPREEPPLDFARKLLVRAHRFDAIVYTACLLSRREGVWWGCQCVRALRGSQADDALLAAEAWVREPEEAQRRAALEIAASGDTGVATTWLAFAAGHSGGSVTAEGSLPVRASPNATAINVKAAVILAIVQRPMTDALSWIEACVEAGLRFADGGDAKVIAPPRAAVKTGAV